MSCVRGAGRIRSFTCGRAALSWGWKMVQRSKEARQHAEIQRQISLKGSGEGAPRRRAWPIESTGASRRFGMATLRLSSSSAATHFHGRRSSRPNHRLRRSLPRSERPADGDYAAAGCAAIVEPSQCRSGRVRHQRSNSDRSGSNTRRGHHFGQRFSSRQLTHLTPEQRAKIIKLYNEGVATEAIASRFGCAKTTVSKLALEAGCRRRHPHKGGQRTKIVDQ